MKDAAPRPLDERRRRRRLAADILKLISVALLFGALGWLINSDFVAGHFDVQAWRAVLQRAEFLGGPALGASTFVVAGGAAIALGIPRIWVAALGGAVYGALFGSVLAIVAALIGSSVLHRVGRVLLRDVVDRRVGGRLETWRERFREDAFWWVLYARLFPLSNSTAVSVLCGSCNVPFGRYAAASFIGFIPYTVIFAMFGSGGAKADVLQLALGLGLMLVVYLAHNALRAVFPVRPVERDAAAQTLSEGVVSERPAAPRRHAGGRA